MESTEYQNHQCNSHHRKIFYVKFTSEQIASRPRVYSSNVSGEKKHIKKIIPIFRALVVSNSKSLAEVLSEVYQ